MNQRKDAIKIVSILISVKQILVSVFLAAIGVNIEIWRLINAKHAQHNVLHVCLSLDVKHALQISTYLMEHVWMDALQEDQIAYQIVQQTIWPG